MVGEKWYATIETTLDIVELKSKIQGYHHAFQAHKAKMKHIQKVIGRSLGCGFNDIKNSSHKVRRTSTLRFEVR